MSQFDETYPFRSFGAKIDSLCDQFESQWKQGTRPELEEFLSGTTGDDDAEEVTELSSEERRVLFDELLRLEVQYRKRFGEDLLSDEYYSRFPEFANEIDAVFEIDETVAPPKSGNPDETLDLGSETKDSGAANVQKNKETFGKNRRFEIMREHARGGLGEIYVARDCELNREVALKEIRPEHAERDDSRSRFLLEAEVTGGLEHPGIVPVYGLGHYEDGRPYYAMRFIRGRSLADAIKEYHATYDSAKPSADQMLELRKLLRRFIDVCNAIQYAHSRGVLHRDLKPDNVMLGKYGETLVVDWGLAKTKQQDSVVSDEAILTSELDCDTATQLGAAMGTPAFMPPEQAAGRLDDLGPASDVYSLGATLYDLLTGRAPIRGNTLSELLKNVQTGNYPRPRELRSDVPHALEAICLHAMQVEPNERYPSPEALAEDVERWLADEPVDVYQEPWLARLRRWTRKHQTLAASTIAVVLVTVLGLGISTSIVSGKNAQLTSLNGTLDEQNTQLTNLNNTLDSQNTQLTELNDTLDSQNEELDAKNSELVVANERTRAAAKKAQASERQERRQRDRAERARYLSDVRLAAAYVDDNQHIEAYDILLDHLKLDRDAEMSWEWTHLLSRADQSLLNWTASSANIPAVAWNHDGSKIATTHWAEGLRAIIWDGKSGKRIGGLRDGPTLKYGADWHPTKNQLAWGCASTDDTLRIFDLDVEKITRLKTGTGSHRSVRWSPDGQRIAVGAIRVDGLHQADTVVVFENKDEKWQVLSRLRTKSGNGVDCVEWSPDGSELLVVNAYSKTWVADPKTLEVLRMSKILNVYSASWHPTEDRIACGNRFGRISILNSKTLQVEKSFDGHLGAIPSLSWSPDGKFLATASADRSVKIWNAENLELVSRFVGHGGIVSSVRWHPNSNQLVSSGFDGIINIWPRESNAAARSFQGAQKFADGSISNHHRFAWLDDQTIRVSKTPDTVVDLDAISGKVRKTMNLPKGFWRLFSQSHVYRFNRQLKGLVAAPIKKGDGKDITRCVGARHMWANPSRISSLFAQPIGVHFESRTWKRRR